MKQKIKFGVFLLSFCFSIQANAIDVLNASDIQIFKEVIQKNSKNFEKISQFKISSVKGVNQNSEDDKALKSIYVIDGYVTYIRIDPAAKKDQTKTDCYEKTADLLSNGSFPILKANSKVRGKAVDGDNEEYIVDTIIDAADGVFNPLNIKGADYDHYQFANIDNDSSIRMVDNDGDTYSALYVLIPQTKAATSVQLTMLTQQEILDDHGESICTVYTANYYSNSKQSTQAVTPANKDAKTTADAKAAATTNANNKITTEAEQKLNSAVDEAIPDKVKIGCSGTSMNLWFFAATILSLLLIRRKNLA